MKKQVTAFICIIVFNFEAIFASTDFSFKRYQVEDGLSHNTTWCSIQDSYGFLWIGTSDGLNCYDGCGNRVYRNALNNKYSLGNNFVSSLLEEGENIWVGTNSGETSSGTNAFYVRFGKPLAWDKANGKKTGARYIRAVRSISK